MQKIKWPDKEINSEKILKSIPEGWCAYDADTGKRLEIGDRFIHLNLKQKVAP